MSNVLNGIEVQVSPPEIIQPLGGSEARRNDGKADGRKGKADGGDSLAVATSSRYDWVWWDKGSGANLDGSFWRASPPRGWYIIGDLAQAGYGNPTGPSLIVRPMNGAVLKPPVSWTRIWTDRGTGSDYDGSIWFPVPPTNYVSLGFVAQLGYDSPEIPEFRCVRSDFVQSEIVRKNDLIWSDQGSGGDYDVSVYKVPDGVHAFVAQADYNPPTVAAFRLLR